MPSTSEPLPPAAPDRDELIAALDAFVTVVQRAPDNTRERTAAQLHSLIKALPALSAAVYAADRPLLAILEACRNTTPAPQSTEVAPDDARDTPGPDRQ